MTSTVLRDLGPHTRAARVLVRTAVFWLASAVVHLGVWAVDGGSWSGSLSWRKPIVFSTSIALTLWAVAWVLDRMPTPRRRLAGTLAWTFAVSSSVETALVAIQAWRGHASHFNVFDPTDAVLFTTMGIIVGVMSLVLVVLLAWVLREPPVDRATRWAVTGGLVAITTGLGIGQWLIELGMDWVATTGTVPEVVMNGDAVVKFPHAVAFHGIQVFAVLLAVARARLLGPDRELAVVRTGVLGYLGLLAWAMATAVVGLAPLATRGWVVALGAVSAATVGVAVLGAVVPVRSMAPRPGVT